MAKTKTISNNFSKTRIALLDGGKTYDVVKPYLLRHLNYELKVDSTLRECEDGYFAAYHALGDKLFFRLGDIAMKDILPNLKLREDEPKSKS